MELETPPPSWKKNILNFHFDYLHPSLSSNSYMTSEPVRSGSISVLHVFKIFFPSLCIRLQQSDESEYKAQSQSNT